MSGNRTRFSRHLCLFCSAFGAASIVEPASAQSVTNARVSATTGLRYDSNPFLLTGKSNEALSVDAEIRPSVSLIERQGRVTLEGYYRRQEYLRRYSGNDSYGGTLSGDYRFNDRFSLTSSVDFVDAIVDASTLLDEGFLATPLAGTSTPGAGPAPTTPLPNIGIIDPSLGDVSLIGLRQRRSQLSFATSLAYRPSVKNSWTIGVSGNRARYPGTSVAASNYRSFGADASYARNLSETSRLGILLTVQQIDFDSSTQNSRIYAPQVTFSKRLERGWSIDAGVGASFIEGNQGASGGTETSLSFQLNACKGGQRSKLCLGATRSATVSALDGIGPQTSVRLSYSYRLSERATVNADASYNRVSRRGIATTSGAQQFASGQIGVRRDLGQRVQMQWLAAYQKRDVANGTGRENISSSIGLVFSLGERR